MEPVGSLTEHQCPDTLALAQEREAWMNRRGIRKMTAAKKTDLAVLAKGTTQDRIAAIRRAAGTGKRAGGQGNKKKR